MTQQIIEKVSIQVNIDRAEVDRKVERAVELNRQIKEELKELDELKVYLREMAATGVFPKTETGAVEIRAIESELCATIAYCKDTPVIMKGADTTQLAALTQGQFDLMFCRVVKMQPADKFEPVFAALPKKVQNVVKRVVVWVPNTPQVNLSK